MLLSAPTKTSTAGSEEAVQLRFGRIVNEFTRVAQNQPNISIQHVVEEHLGALVLRRDAVYQHSDSAVAGLEHLFVGESLALRPDAVYQHRDSAVAGLEHLSAGQDHRHEATPEVELLLRSEYWFPPAKG